MFVHLVFFYKRPEATVAQVDQLLADCYRLLGAIPEVLLIQAGTPAMTARADADNSYAVGLSVTLADAAAHAVYQKHPLHLEFIARNKPTWTRVQVYDFLARG